MYDSVDNYTYDELQQMEKDYALGKEIPCPIDEVDHRIAEIDTLGF